MYLDFYGFREKPFNLTPDPSFVFLSRTHKEAFAHLLYGINNRTGFIGLTGEVGSGKTTVLRALFSQLDADHHRTALIFNPCLSASELLQSINREFGISTYTSDSSGALNALNLFLLEQNTEGRTVVLAIDEAQNLETSVLEQIRLISNLETDREKLIQIVLSGQPELEQILKRDEMRQLSQRIIVRYHLQPMDFQDTVHYISHRLEVAGGRGVVSFSKRAIKRIYRYSRGLPRPINAACDRALMVAYARNKARISSRIAAAGINDMIRNMSFYTRRQRLILIPMFAMLAAILAAGVYFGWPDFADRLIPSRHVEAIGEQTKKDPAIPDEEPSRAMPAELGKISESDITGKELSRAISAEFGKISESESAQRAFNVLAGFWNIPPVSEGVNFNQLQGIELAALDRQLRLYRFSGNLGALLRIDHPVVLELTLPGIPGKRFVSLVGVEKEELIIDPPIAGKRSFSFSQIEKYWTGQTFLLWKDPLNLQTKMAPGSRGENIKRLQGLLREAGAYKRPLTGVFDGNTISAIKEFQSSRGIEPDGIVGSQTLMLLYRSIDRFDVPRLTVGKK
jgi:general secretion pathway protein A